MINKEFIKKNIELDVDFISSNRIRRTKEEEKEVRSNGLRHSIKFVKEHTNVTDEELFPNVKSNHKSPNRLLVMWLLFNYYGWKISEISSLFNRTHSTIVRNIQKTDLRLSE